MVRGCIVACFLVSSLTAIGILGREPVTRPANAAAVCGGVDRWDIKTLSDLRAPNPPVLKRDAELRTMDYLVSQQHPPIGKHTPRLPGVESTKYVLKDVTVVEAKVEADQDVHLVIRDDHGLPTDRMIVEFPNSECNATPPPVYLGLIRKARRAINDFITACRSGGKNGWVQLRGTARIRGVASSTLSTAPANTESRRTTSSSTRRSPSAGRAKATPDGRRRPVDAGASQLPEVTSEHGARRRGTRFRRPLPVRLLSRRRLDARYATRLTSRVRELPGGTVTFLFTDVEGSTRLLHELGPERYAEALAEHRRVVREACARHRGVEVDVQGDAVFVAFATAPGALHAARELTEALASGRFRVRVGVHTGTPLLTEEGYVGADVHRAARIAAAAHGGQVLVSESTAALADEALRPLGEHRLRDLLEPVRLFQLGEGEFPTPMSLGGMNLPVQPTPFVGRERELAEALALLRDSRVRLLTLTGAGGTGKTRLALQVAAEAAADYQDGVFWVPLQGLRDPELVESTIAQVVGARQDLIFHLRSKRALLLVDNFEHVIGAAPKLGEFCARLPSLKLLVTSREPLHLAAEREYPVPPLREREAVMFFGDRARAVNPDFAEDDAVVEICRRLDCLPLALELAAARVKALSTDDLLRRLDKRLPLLTGGPRDAPERQRTLRATIGWSYELLTADARRAFAGLAVFVGGCTLEAAEEVCQADVDTIAELLDKSLLRREGQRYFMLETIGEFALERLVEGGELERLRRRHAEYYLELARSVEDLIRSPQAAALLDRLERDHDNLRAALRWLPGATPDRALRIAVWGLSGRLQNFGDIALDRRNILEAARLYRESLEIGRQLRDDLQTAYSLAGLAAVGAKQGRRDLAACLWGCVRTFEERSGARLHVTERTRYERVLDELEQPLETSPDFTRGKSMTLDEAVDYALANVV